MAIDMRGQITSEKIAIGAVDGDKHIIAGTVGTARFALASVTSQVLADNAVTPVKVNEKVRTRPLASDDTEVTNAAATDKTVDFEVKNVRFAVKDAVAGIPDKIVVAVEIKTSVATSMTTLSAYLDDEASPRASVSTASTSYDLVTISFTAGIGAAQIADGSHSLKLKIKSSLAIGIASLKLTEVYQIIL